MCSLPHRERLPSTEKVDVTCCSSFSPPIIPVATPFFSTCPSGHIDPPVVALSFTDWRVSSPPQACSTVMLLTVSLPHPHSPRLVGSGSSPPPSSQSNSPYLAPPSLPFLLFRLAVPPIIHTWAPHFILILDPDCLFGRLETTLPHHAPPRVTVYRYLPVPLPYAPRLQQSSPASISPFTHAIPLASPLTHQPPTPLPPPLAHFISSHPYPPL